MTWPRACVSFPGGVYHDLCMLRVHTIALCISCSAYSVPEVCGEILDIKAIGYQD